MKSTVTIIVPTRFATAEHFVKCVESLYIGVKGADAKARIVVVFDGTPDDVVKESYQGMSKRPTVIRRKTSDGYAIACNEGMKAHPADYYVLVNDDVEVGEGWLDGLLATMKADDALGIVVPLTNTHNGMQNIAEMIKGQSLPTFGGKIDPTAYTKRLIKGGWATKYFPISKIVAFSCAMISHEFVEMIGYQDERFPMGLGADDDYCWKAQRVGRKIGVALGVYVNHGHRTSFKKLGQGKCRKLEQEAHKMITKKWNYAEHDPLKMISVIIPTYNCATDLHKCLASWRKQTNEDFEVIVVDDGSTDKTVDLLTNFNEVIVMKHETNRGANAARNTGLSIAGGAYVFVGDADAQYSPDILQKMLDALESAPHHIGYVYCNWFNMGTQREGFTITHAFDIDDLKRDNYIPMPSLIRRSALDALGQPVFDESIARLQDWDLWLRLAQEGICGMHLPEVLFVHHMRKASITQLDGKSYKDARKVVIAKHRGWTPKNGDVHIEHPLKVGTFVTFSGDGRGEIVGIDHCDYTIKNDQIIAGIMRTLRFRIAQSKITGVLQDASGGVQGAS